MYEGMKWTTSHGAGHGMRTLAAPRNNRLARRLLIGCATVLTVVGILTPGRARAELYEITDLGTLSNSFSRASGVNESGKVVGTSVQQCGFTAQHAFLWVNGVMTDIGPDACNYGEAFDINVAGDVVGTAVAGTAPTTIAFLWRDGAMIDLGDLGDPNGFHAAYGINAAGVVAGSAQLPEGIFTLHAFNWIEPYEVCVPWPFPPFVLCFMVGGMLDLGTLGGTDSEAYDINDPEHIVGWAHTPGGKEHAFLLKDGVMIDLDQFDTFKSAANAINDAE